MRFSFAESMCDPSHYLPLAQAAEEAGWTSFIVPDSICYPEESDSRYPYTPDGDREFLEDKPFIEPFSLIPAHGRGHRRGCASRPSSSSCRSATRCSSPSRPRRSPC